jgi:thiol-disulfide isomerase/thioredoxin
MLFINHENELTWNNKYQGLYFYATWMPFNQKVICMLDMVSDNLPNVPLFAIDVDHFKSFCKRFDITTIPTILIMENGKEVKRIQGVTHSKEFVATFSDICTE